MKRAIIVLLIVVSAFFPRKASYFSYAPELYGLGETSAIQIGQAEIGKTHSTWADGSEYEFILVASNGKDGIQRGYVIQVSGQTIGQYGPYNKSTPWAYYFERDLNARWRGFMEFRGTQRKFCGAPDVDKIPVENCHILHQNGQ